MIVNAVNTHRNFKEAVRSLRRPGYPAVFESLSATTVREWYDGYRLKPSVERRWKSGAPAQRGIGRCYALATVSTLEQYLIDIFTRRRDSGHVVNSIVAVSILRSVISARAPHLLDRMSLSRRWVRQWLRCKCGFTYKKATTSGQKLPTDWKKQVDLMIDRAAAVVSVHKVAHPSLVINWDQSAVVLMPTPVYSYHSKKDKHVSVVGQDEKRQITAVVAGALSGEVLPLQLIFTGQDKNAQKKQAVPSLSSILSTRIIQDGWDLTQTHNHWSSQQSMLDYVQKIIDPWVKRKREEHNCLDSHVLLLFDCWSVHKSKEFMDWMRAERPDYHIVFIPAGCTGKAQPADVIMQRPFKCEISNRFLQWTTDTLAAQLQAGTDDIPDLMIDKRMPVLKPLLVQWAWESWNLLRERREMLVKGWAKIGLDVIFDHERQRNALANLFKAGISLDVFDGDVESAQDVSEADKLELLAEEEECDEDNAVEEDEEEPDLDVCIAACLEEVPVISGRRRSSRLQGQEAVQRDRHIAQLMQESTYEDGLRDD
jgi:DDE superfamily endonuclease